MSGSVALLFGFACVPGVLEVLRRLRCFCSPWYEDTAHASRIALNDTAASHVVKRGTFHHPRHKKNIGERTAKTGVRFIVL